MRLSVIIPTRNRPEWLQRALGSVLNGRPPKDEVEVVVTDNSTDPRSEEISRAETSGPAVRYFRNEPPTGMVENWNAGLSRAVGDWVVFLHDDDYFLPDWWAHLGAVWAMESFQLHGHAFSVQPVDEQGRRLRRGGQHRSRTMRPREATRELLTHSSLIRFPGMVLRRSWLIERGGFDPVWEGLADLDMWLKVAEEGGIAFHAVKTSAYTIHAEAATGRMFGEDTLRGVFELGERCLSKGLIGAEELQVARARFFWRFILAGAWRARCRGDRMEVARILGLRELPTFAGLRCPLRLRPIDWFLASW